MKVEVRPLNKNGRELPKQARAPACRGKLKVYDDRLRVVGRWVKCATVVSETDGLETRVLPDLVDVELLWLDAGRMRLRGNEEVLGALMAQTWEVKAVG